MDPELTAQKLADLSERSAQQQRRFHARAPKSAKDLMARLLTQRRYAAIESNSRLEAAWAEAAGELLSRYTRASGLRRGVLEVLVANNAIMQELGFERERLLGQVKLLLPEAQIKDLKFRLGSASSFG